MERRTCMGGGGRREERGRSGIWAGMESRGVNDRGVNGRGVNGRGVYVAAEIAWLSIHKWRLFNATHCALVSYFLVHPFVTV